MFSPSRSNASSHPARSRRPGPIDRFLKAGRRLVEKVRGRRDWPSWKKRLEAGFHHQRLEDRVMLTGATLSIDDASVLEGDGAAVQADFQVRLSEALASPVTVDFQTVDITARAGEDYLATSGTLNFAPGETVKSVGVPVLGDLLSETDETFFLSISNPQGATITGVPRGHGTILDNDPLPQVSIDDVSLVEKDAGAQHAWFTVALSEPSGRAVVINYQSSDLTATAGEDYEAVLGALSFGPGETVRTLPVSVYGDLIDESDEVFRVELTGASGAEVVAAEGLATLTDDDVQYLVAGADSGEAPLVRVLHPLSGAEHFSFHAYDQAFTGGVRVTTADVNADGVPDIVTAAGPGGGPHVRVFDGVTGGQLPGAIGGFFAYDSDFSGGLFVAAADVNADGYADVVTGPGSGPPRVKVFSGKDGSELTSFFAYSPAFHGGVHVAAADFNHDGQADIVTGAGPGGGPHVRVFDGATGEQLPGLIGSFFAYDPHFSGGSMSRRAT